MTREETKKCIEVMQAYVDGKEIEANVSCGDATWNVVDDILWNWWSNIYRIKEEPKKEIPEWLKSLIVTPESTQKLIDSIKEEQRSRFLDRLSPEELVELQIEEPKPFDWRGKNIQWVRNGEDLVVKVLEIRKRGIVVGCNNMLICDETEDVSLSQEARVTLMPWKIAQRDWQWSSDNATWRKFE